MDVVGRQHTLDDPNAQLGADLADNLAKPFAHFATQHLVAILRDPDEVKTMIEFGMTTRTIGHIRSDENQCR